MSNKTRMCGDYAKQREALKTTKKRLHGYTVNILKLQNTQEDEINGRKSKSSMSNVNSKWNDDELHWYRQFIESGTIEQLAYTAVQEAHLRRKATEELDDQKKRITAAIKKMCLGLDMLQKELGIDLHKMAVECAEEELNEFLGTSEERFARSPIKAL